MGALWFSSEVSAEGGTTYPEITKKLKGESSTLNWGSQAMKKPELRLGDEGQEPQTGGTFGRSQTRNFFKIVR